MATCLIALGSNQGDRAATLDTAIAMLDAMPDLRLRECSTWRPTQPLGLVGVQHEFLNGAARFETGYDAENLLAILQQIENAHGRTRLDRWCDRTLDLDLLLHDEQIIDTPTLTVPHPRMSFRRFVLEPAAEIAGQWVHPTIGWTLGQLLHHLDAGADHIAIISPVEPARRKLCTMLAEQCGAVSVGAPIVDDRWPVPLTNWLSVPTDVRTRTSDVQAYPAAHVPKLTISLDPPAACDANWAAFVQLSGRGPALRISAGKKNNLRDETLAAVQSVWPHLGRLGQESLQ